MILTGVDEQLIMEKTGHHSLEGVRSYKRTSSKQQEDLTDILSLSKKSCPTSTNNQSPDTNNGTSTSHTPSTTNVVAIPRSSSPTQLQSVQNNSQQLLIHPDNLKNMFTLNNCSAVHINVNF